MKPDGAVFHGFTKDITGPEELEIICGKGNF